MVSNIMESISTASVRIDDATVRRRSRVRLTDAILDVWLAPSFRQAVDGNHGVEGRLLGSTDGVANE